MRFGRGWMIRLTTSLAFHGRGGQAHTSSLAIYVHVWTPDAFARRQKTPTGETAVDQDRGQTDRVATPTRIGVRPSVRATPHAPPRQLAADDIIGVYVI